MIGDSEGERVVRPRRCEDPNHSVEVLRGPAEARTPSLPWYRCACACGGRRGRQPTVRMTNYVRTAKYTLFTWIPLSSFNQFKRAANIWFLVISILTCMPFSPKNPISMIGTFAAVLIFSILKDGYEDLLRHRHDQETNLKSTRRFCFKEGKWEGTTWQDVRVGDIVAVLKNESFPADLVLICSSHREGLCFVDTANLDGETNLKRRRAPAELHGHFLQNKYRLLEARHNGPQRERGGGGGGGGGGNSITLSLPVSGPPTDTTGDRRGNSGANEGLQSENAMGSTRWRDRETETGGMQRPPSASAYSPSGEAQQLLRPSADKPGSGGSLFDQTALQVGGRKNPEAEGEEEEEGLEDDVAVPEGETGEEEQEEEEEEDEEDLEEHETPHGEELLEGLVCTEFHMRVEAPHPQVGRFLGTYTIHDRACTRTPPMPLRSDASRLCGLIPLPLPLNATTSGPAPRSAFLTPGGADRRVGIGLGGSCSSDVHLSLSPSPSPSPSPPLHNVEPSPSPCRPLRAEEREREGGGRENTGNGSGETTTGIGVSPESAGTSMPPSPIALPTVNVSVMGKKDDGGHENGVRRGEKRLSSSSSSSSCREGVLEGRKGVRSSSSSSYLGEEFPLSPDSLLYRGCVLRNSRWVVGLVVYAGGDTKIRMNSAEAPSKMSQAQRTMNSLLRRIFFALFAICLTFAVVSYIFDTQLNSPERAWYLWADGSSPGHPASAIVFGFLTFLVAYSHLIPISLYVALEMLKVALTWFIRRDKALLHEETGVAARARTSDLVEELGQVSFVFSDKTGTLTSNSMELLKVCVNGKAYGPSPREAEEARFEGRQEEGICGDRSALEALRDPQNPDRRALLRLFTGMAVCHSVLPDRKSASFRRASARALVRSFRENLGREEEEEDSVREGQGRRRKSGKKKGFMPLPLGGFCCQQTPKEKDEAEQAGEREERARDGLGAPKDSAIYFSPPCASPLVPSYSPSAELPRGTNSPPTEEKRESSFIRESRISLSSLPPLIYQGTSPDEVALVDAAARQEVQFLGQRTKKGRRVLTLRVFNQILKFEALHEISFSAERKRMTVVVEHLDSVWVITKGADTVMLPLLLNKRGGGEESDTSSSRGIDVATARQMDEFSRMGLRTLVFGCRKLEEEEYAGWRLQWQRAELCNDLESREAQMEACASILEDRLELLGVTAVEDRLQEEVPQTIRCLRQMGLRLWVLTGDKVETAVEIGFSCGLLSQQKMKLCVLQKAKSTAEAVEEFRRVLEEEAGGCPPLSVSHSAHGRREAGRGTGRGRGVRAPPPTESQSSRRVRLLPLAGTQRDNTLERETEEERHEERRSGNSLGGSLHSNSNGHRISQQQHQKDGGTKTSIPLSLSVSSRRRSRDSSSSSSSATNASNRGDGERGEGGRTHGSSSKLALAIDGETIGRAMEADEEGRRLFVELCLRASVCICCRLAPAQKAQIVRMVREELNVVTLAIGDGANDVSMIQEAHIGIGVHGKEGAQAVQASDFVVPQFRYLLPLLQVHGRAAYRRVSIFVCYYLYKNVALVSADVLWSLFSGFSGQIFFPEWLTTCFNAFWTSWPCLFNYALDEDVSAFAALQRPQLYGAGPAHAFLNSRTFNLWVLLGLLHGAVAFVIPLFGMWGPIDESGQVKDYWLPSLVSFSAVVFIVCGKLALETSSWTWMQVAVLVASLVFYFLCALILNTHPFAITFQWNLRGLVDFALSSALPLLLMLTIPVIALIPDFFWSTFRLTFFPNPLDVEMFRWRQAKADNSCLNALPECLTRPWCCPRASTAAGRRDGEEEEEGEIGGFFEDEDAQAGEGHHSLSLSDPRQQHGDRGRRTEIGTEEGEGDDLPDCEAGKGILRRAEEQEVDPGGRGRGGSWHGKSEHEEEGGHLEGRRADGLLRGPSRRPPEELQRGFPDGGGILVDSVKNRALEKGGVGETLEEGKEKENFDFETRVRGSREVGSRQQERQMQKDEERHGGKENFNLLMNSSFSPSPATGRERKQERQSVSLIDARNGDCSAPNCAPDDRIDWNILESPPDPGPPMSSINEKKKVDSMSSSSSSQPRRHEPKNDEEEKEISEDKRAEEMETARAPPTPSVQPFPPFAPVKTHFPHPTKRASASSIQSAKT